MKINEENIKIILEKNLDLNYYGFSKEKDYLHKIYRGKFFENLEEINKCIDIFSKLKKTKYPEYLSTTLANKINVSNGVCILSAIFLNIKIVRSKKYNINPETAKIALSKNSLLTNL